MQWKQRFGNVEYVALRLIRRFLFPRDIARWGRYLPYYRTNVSETTPDVIAQKYVKWLEKSRIDPAGRSVVEVGSGTTNAVGYAMACVGFAEVWCVEPFAKFDAAKDDALLRQLCRVHALDPATIRSKVTRCASIREIGRGRADIVVSHSVLEHVREVEPFFADCRLALTPRGVMLHIVDYRDHYFKFPLQFLKFREQVWNTFLNPGDLPRWRLADHLDALGKSGFESDILERIDGTEELHKLGRISADFDLRDPDLAVLGATILSRIAVDDDATAISSAVSANSPLKLIETPPRKQILLVLDHLGVGGLQEFFLNIVKAGNDIAAFTVVSLFGNDVYSDRLRLAGAEVIFCSRRKYTVPNVLRLSGLRQFRQFLRENEGRFDRIHIRLFAAFLFSSFLGLYHRKEVTAGLDAAPHQLPWYVYVLYLIFARRYQRFFIPPAYFDQYDALRLRRDRMFPVRYLITERRSDHPIPFPHQYNIVSIGRCIEQKGFMETVLLFEKVCSLTPRNLGLYIIGDGPERPRLERYIQEHGLTNVHCPGTIVNIDDYIAPADMIIKMARGEGVNSVVREALLARKTMVTTMETSECRAFAAYGLVIAIDRDDLDKSARTMLRVIDGSEFIDLERASLWIQSSVERAEIVESMC